MPFSERNDKRKLILIGTSGAGKTSMRSMIFSNYTADDTKYLTATIDLESSVIRILDQYLLTVLDLGGQTVFTEHWNRNSNERIYKGVHVLIFVSDCCSEEWLKDLGLFLECLQHLRVYSPDAKIFFMLHKIDLLDHWKESGFSKRKKIEHRKEIDQRLSQFKTYIQQQINKTQDTDDNYKSTILNKINFESTTIYNDSLYSAWGKIISNIVPNLREYEVKIRKFCQEIKADECVLFEKNTYLPIVSCRTEFIAKERQIEVNEIMTNRLKQMSSNIYDPHVANHRNSHKKQNFTLKTDKYQLYFRQFTTNTFILLVFYMTSARKSDQMHKIDYLCMNDEPTTSTTSPSLLTDTNLPENLTAEQREILTQFKSKLTKIDPEQNDVGFDQQSLIETCLNEFREEMKRLDAGEKKAYNYNYTPRER